MPRLVLVPRLVLTAIFLIGLLGVTLPQSGHAATLSQLLQKQADLKKQADDSQKKIDQKKRDAANLKQTISDLEGDIGDTATKIANTESQIETTNQVIAALAQDVQSARGQLDELNSKLKSAYVTLYELSQTSPVETLLQTKSLDDLVSQAQYIQAIQTNLQEDISKANAIKADLESKKADTEAQKAELEKLNQDLNTSKRDLTTRKSQKNYLLAQTQGDQVKYEKLLADIKNEATKISSEIYTKRLQLGGFINSGGTGGYPYASSTPDVPDPWGFLTRECTSYASWKFLQNFGIPFVNTRPGSGSAWNWPNLAHDQGYHTSSSPTVGAVVSWPAGSLTSSYGHVAAVEVVYSAHDVIVSEYNWNRFAYSERRIDPTNFGSPTYITP